MVNIVERLNSKINEEFDEQLILLSGRFQDQPIQTARQIAVLSTIRDTFNRDAADIIEALSLPEQGRLLQVDNLLLYFMELYDTYAAESEIIMTNFFKSVLPTVELSYMNREVS